ncbi:MAG: M23 family metallopeptidase [Defluviitaleaceae bacterium]|nr:M23 family metallopeptidase [Defluviitaleaceae bacterium]
MNNKDPKEHVFRKKGFYVALYSCLGVVMVTTAVISLNNLTGRQDFSAERSPQIDIAQLEPVGANDGMSILERQAIEDEIALRRSRTAPTPTPGEGEQPGGMTATPAPRPETSPSPQPQPGAQAPAPAVPPTTEPMTSPAPATEPSALEEAYDETVYEGEGAQSPYLFEFFDISQRMEWPVLGQVVMNYSSDRLIYDMTLDQYRTNDTISISAELGSQVLASAAGIVDFVGYSRETGNYVVINHGNGWITTYGQLQDGVLVRVGDVVRAGQPVGGVGNPSIYSVLLGNHINFRVENHGITVDPQAVLR